MTFKTIREIVHNVGLEAARAELPSIVRCKDVFPDETDFQASLEGIEIAMSLAEVTPLVNTMLDVCKQYHFICCAASECAVTDDEQMTTRKKKRKKQSRQNGREVDKSDPTETENSVFAALEALTEKLSDSARMDGATITECRHLAESLSTLLMFKLSDQSSRDGLLLFQQLSQAEDVWSFVHEKKWHGKEGLLRFHDEYSNVTNLLQGETYETEVLDHLDPAVRYISLLVEARTTPMPEFLQLIRNDRTVSGVGQRSKFKELETAQRNISRIREWFTLGLGGLEVVFLQFKEMAETGCYNFKINVEPGEDAEMTVTYQGSNGSVELKSNELKVLRHLHFLLIFR